MRWRFDPTMRGLIEMGPPDWPAYLGFPVAEPGRVIAIDSNVSTVTAEAHKVSGWTIPSPGSSTSNSRQVGTSSWRIGAHVQRVAACSPQGADSNGPGPAQASGRRAGIDGVLRTKAHHDGEVYDSFRYHVLRVWEQPVELLLASGLTILPLAPVSDVKEEDVPGVLMAVSERLAKRPARTWRRHCGTRPES